MVRETQAEKRQRLRDTWERDSQRLPETTRGADTVRRDTARDRPIETAGERQAAYKFPEAAFPIQGHGFGGRSDLGRGCRSAHTLTRTHTHPYIIYLFIHNRYKCLSETRKGINSYGRGLGSGRETHDGHLECSPCSTRAAWPTRFLKISICLTIKFS